MSKLDYSRLKHSKEKPVKSHTRKESFYLQKGNGRADAYWGKYKGDFSVFMSTWQTIERNSLPEGSIEMEDQAKCRKDNDGER